VRGARLDAATIGPRLDTRWLGRNWHHRRSARSTNDDARELAEAGAAHGTVATADSQRGGRGRRGRAWHSPDGGLFLSVVLRPRVSAEALAPLGLAVAVAVAEAVEQHGGTMPTLKWPNDVLLAERKVAGILVEAAIEGSVVRHVIVGIGVNLNVTRFPARLADTAVSLHRVRGSRVDPVEFATGLCAQLETWVDLFEREGAAAVAAAWQARGQAGKHVRVVSGAGVVEGIAEGLDPDGALRIRLADGSVRRVVSGELS